MASSTKRPMASTIANMVSMLMVNPKSPRMANVPRMTTGTAIVGISVARMLPRKSSMTKKTSTIAITSVLITSLMETLIKTVESFG